MFLCKITIPLLFSNFLLRINFNNSSNPLSLKGGSQKIISNFVENIPKIRDRVLVKLKTYIDGYTILKDDEYDYLEGLSDISDVKTFISENIYDNKCGMKDKDICKLMDIKKGSINTTYQRIVSKYLIEPYKIYKAKNG